MAYLAAPPVVGASRGAATPDLGRSLVAGTAGTTQANLQSPATDQNSDPLSTLISMRQQAQAPQQQSQSLSGAGLLNPNYSQSASAGGSAVPTAASIGSAPSGNLASWITQAEKIDGVDPNAWTNALNLIIQHESGGNPQAINNWDSNAKAGHPSQGLMQTIPGTFSAYVPPSLASAGILDPVANIAAGIRYIISRYGGINNVPGVVAVAQGRPYVGY